MEPVVKYFNIFFIEYADIMIKMMQCYDSPAQPWLQIGVNFLSKFKQRIALIKKCYQGIDEIDFMKNCWFLCRSFKWDKISPIYEGATDLYKNLSFILKSFLRRQQMPSRSSQIKNMKFNQKKDLTLNGLLIEPISPSLLFTNNHFEIEEKLRKDILNNFDQKLPLTKNQLKRLENYLKKTLTPDEIHEIKALMIKRKKKLREYMKKQFKLRKYKNFFEQNEKKIELNSQKKNYLHMKRQVKLYKGKDSKTDKKKRVNRRLKKQEKQEFIKYLQEKIFRKERFLKQKQDQLEEIQNQIIKKILIKDQNFAKSINLFHTNEQEERNLKVKPQQEEIEIDDEKARVELGLQIFEKQESFVDLKLLKMQFKSTGIDLLRGNHFVNYALKTTELVSEFFTKSENLEPGAIQDYLKIQNQSINKFNHVIDMYYMQQSEMVHNTSKYMKSKQEMLKSTSEVEKNQKKMEMQDQKKELELITIKINDQKKIEEMKK